MIRGDHLEEMEIKKRIHNNRINQIMSVTEEEEEIWTISSDHSIKIFNRDMELIYDIGDQGSYVKYMCFHDNRIWTINNKSIKIFSTESIWMYLINKVSNFILIVL